MDILFEILIITNIFTITANQTRLSAKAGLLAAFSVKTKPRAKAVTRTPLKQKRRLTAEKTSAPDGVAGDEIPEPRLRAIELPVETAKIRLGLKDLSPAQLEALLVRIASGMQSTPVYAQLPAMADVDSVRIAVSAQRALVQALETQLKEARLTLHGWAQTAWAVRRWHAKMQTAAPAP